MRPVRVVQAGLVVLVAGLSYGDAGALLAVLVLAVLALLVAVGSLPTSPRRKLRPVAEQPVAQHFPSYDRIYGAIVLAATSQRHLDQNLRPALQRVLAAELERHGSEAVRARIGERWWALLDPSRPNSSDSSAAGIDPRSLGQLLDTLEDR